jgi:hypothetical protein
MDGYQAHTASLVRKLDWDSGFYCSTWARTGEEGRNNVCSKCAKGSLCIRMMGRSFTPTFLEWL